jgi:hypothetical protein
MPIDPATATASELDNMLARLVEMQEDVVVSDAVPVSLYVQEGGYYWTNTVTGFTVQLVSEELQVITYQITMRLVLATVTEGFLTEAEQKLHKVLPPIILYFSQRRQLKRTSADSTVPYLDPRGAVIVGGQVRDDIQNSGIGQLMFGLDINIEVPLYQTTSQLVF